ncbi:enoyl-CoA hydratase/isomerase family protein [Maritalea mobilis]|uniref:3-hydroxyacyl-CoA dehydrogenase NAD-binding domain-containing protein n=1 Tax=Maritalea mobilis TaxID=483324 RepID=UPI001C95954C|nr:3-hydroxyacyl-CoA dehydrogenase NAD-binding domain-containing protein [Maritalea mobilis]MBY6201012.1 enoyl-CoA hydratase/isomerase family protein [Maritalea mobilis]
MTAEITAESDVIRVENRDGVAIVTIDNPPVNAGSLAVREGLLAAIGRASGDDTLSGVVLIGAGRTFIAGADIREFGAPLAAPQLPDVIAAIEACPHPVAAAIHGAALGGGYELALGCDLRIAAPRAVVGLPEVTLGIVPGAGGTQRLPRLVGVAKSIGLIAGGTRVPAQQALDLGMIDAIADSDAPDDLIAAAISAIRAAPTKRILRDLPVPVDTPDEIDAAEASALKRGKGRPNLREAIRLTRLSADTDADTALAEERRVFQQLRGEEDAYALRHLFFAERVAGRIDGLEARPMAITRIGIVGGGTMGQGIARAALKAGLPVTLVERDAEAARASAMAVADNLQGQVQKGRIAPDEAQRRLDALTSSASRADLSDCDVVIEAVFEDMQIKKDLLADLEHHIRPDAILATNTSYLDIDEMAAGVSHRARVLGLHFFAPADVMRLLEIVRADATDDSALATALSLTKRLGKQPVVARVAEGFIGNRIYAAYRRHAEFLVEDGATPQAVDAAATGFGFAMGPLAVSDLSGLDIAWKTRQRLAATRDPKERYCTIPDRLCEAGRLGRKTGGGWHDYPSGRAEPSETTARIMAEARAAAGVTPRDIPVEEIEARLLGAILNEAALVLEEGIAQRPGDIDVALVHGFGFPRWRGGPIWWGSGQSEAKIAGMLDAVARAAGKTFRRGPVEDMLAPFRAERAENEKRKRGDA